MIQIVKGHFMEYTLITGASKGIGKALAYECARRGMPVLLTARSAEDIKNLAEDIEAQYGVSASWFVADLFDPKAPQQIYILEYAQ